MKIEVGKYYRTHEGKKAYVAYEIPHPAKHYCRFSGWVGLNDGNVVAVWKDDGTNNTDTLVSEWVEKPEWCKGNPAWARWQAHDEDGECFWHECKPFVKSKMWDAEGGECGGIPMAHTPLLPPGCHWQDSLVEAPEGWGK